MTRMPKTQLITIISEGTDFDIISSHDGYKIVDKFANRIIIERDSIAELNEIIERDERCKHCKTLLDNGECPLNREWRWHED